MRLLRDSRKASNRSFLLPFTGFTISGKPISAPLNRFLYRSNAVKIGNATPAAFATRLCLHLSRHEGIAEGEGPGNLSRARKDARGGNEVFELE